MKKLLWITPFLLLAACSVEEPASIESNVYYPEEVTASIDNYSSKPETKVYLDESLKVLWTNDDRISLFNKYTYNKEYRFSGRTGANSGVFKEVSSGEVIVGNELNYVYAVYPYDELTEISNSGVITLDLPSEQAYAENSFGLGANTMVSATTNTELLFKNLCGYVVLKLYGDGIYVSSITFKGNNGEVLAGTADISAAVGSAPTLSFRTTGTSNSITLNCATPVELGATAEDATVFWLVVPPLTFSKGFTITVTDPEGNTFEKSTSSSKEVVRNRPFRMGALEVVYETAQPNNVIYYTSTDGEIVSPYKTDAFGADIVSNTYENGRGVLTFDEMVTRIGTEAFGDCTNLTSITLPKCITFIGLWAFAGCSNLISVVIPESVTSIGNGAFQDCTNLASLIIPESVTSIGSSVFLNCTGLVSIEIPGSVTMTPSFEGCSSLMSVTMHEGVTNIGHRSFKDCTSLTSIDIPTSVINIGNSAFSGCSSLTSVVIPDSVTSIGDYTFYGCKNLASIAISDDVTSIGSSAFSGCSSLISVPIPASVISIGSSAFSGCSSLISVPIPASVISIGSYAFSGCSSLTSVIIPDGVTSIGIGAFSDCSSLISVTIPESVTSIEFGVFSYCTNLASIVIPESVTSIVAYAFSGCSSLSSIVIPKGVTNIGERSFKDCTSLTSLVIPENVTSIEAGLFQGCSSLTSVVIPESVTTIGVQAFADCSSLESVYCKPYIPPTITSPFTNTNNCSIYVPAGAVEAYKTDDNWRYYADRIQAIPE